MRDNRLVQYVILILAVAAGLAMLKFGASFLPENGFLGAIKTVIVSL